MVGGGEIALNPAVAQVPVSYLSSLPAATFQFVPHSSFQKVHDALPWVVGRGFDAIHLGPLHAPTQLVIDGKGGSCYAPQHHMGVAPYLYDESVNPHEWMKGAPYDHYADMDAGWVAVGRLTDNAGSHGLKVIGDLVFSHTARDEGTIKHHLEMVSQDFYRRHADGTIAHDGAWLDGKWDAWTDTAAINHHGEEVIQYLTDVVVQHMLAGISVFRADSAGKLEPDVWRQIISGAREYADRHDMPVPRFYAEVFDNQADLISAGFDDTVSLWRWGIDRLKLDNAEYIRAAGGSGMLYPDNQDVDRVSANYPDRQRLYSYLTLMTFMTSSVMFLEGTTRFAKRRPSVFLDRVGESYRRFEDDSASDLALSELIRKLVGLKKRYPVFNARSHTRLEYDGSGLTTIRRVLPIEGDVLHGAEEALLVWNPHGHTVGFDVPRGFQRGGHLFWTNNTRFGLPGEHLNTRHYDIPGRGVSIFIRRIPDIATLGYTIP